MEVRKAVFLDRDGVLNEEVGYITDPTMLRLLPGVGEAVARFSAASWSVFVFTNQSGVGRGYVTQETLEATHALLRSEIEAAGGSITAIYACPHAPDAGCDCRKPKPGMLLRAAEEYHLNLPECFVIGDTPRDIAAGQSAGCKTVLVLTGHTRSYLPVDFPDPQPHAVFNDLQSATDWLLAHE